ncbi:MAG: sigma factor-like helix-turn-helix DNA-binding protein [Planctomycetota bacterium]
MAWLIGILRRKVVDAFRDAASDATDSVGGENGVEALFDRQGHWRRMPGDWPGDPGEHLRTEEFWRVLAACIARLPDRPAAVFLLREVDELASREVCRQLRISTANLWTQLHRARLLLRECLERNWFRPGSGGTSS